MARKKNKGNHNTIVIVKQDGIGDFFLFLPAAEELRKFYADKKIILCCGPQVEELALSTGFFDEVIVFEDTDVQTNNLLATYKKFSAIQADLLLHPTQPRSVEAELIACFINAKRKVASFGESGALTEKVKQFFDKTYDELVDTGVRNMTMIQTANFLRAVGLKDYKARRPRYQNVQSFSMSLPEKYFVVFLGGSVFNKLWPPERFYEVADYIASKTGWKCVLCGTELDIPQGDIFKRQGNMEFYSLIAKTSMQELISVIAGAQLVVGNDTCAIHMANATDVPSICVRGQFSGNKFYPYVVEEKNEGDIFPISVDKPAHCGWCTLRKGGYHCLHGDYRARKKVKCLMRVEGIDVIRAFDAFWSARTDIEK